MGQMEVYKFLKENKDRWFTSKEIQQEMGLANLASVTTNLRKLRDNGNIGFKKL